MTQVTATVFSRAVVLEGVNAYIRTGDRGEEAGGYFVAPKEAPIDVGETCWMRTADGRSGNIQVIGLVPDGGKEVHFRGVVRLSD